MIRIPEHHYRQAVDDLARAHPIASERVGFLFANTGTGPTGPILLVHDYHAVPDEQYLDRPDVGAAITGDAIRNAMQHGLSTRSSVFHVHAHVGHGMPRFSRTDLEGYTRMIPSFRATVPSVAHGAIVLSDDHAAGLVWYPGQERPQPTRIRIVGFPLRLWETT